LSVKLLINLFNLSITMKNVLIKAFVVGLMMQLPNYTIAQFIQVEQDRSSCKLTAFQNARLDSIINLPSAEEVSIIRIGILDEITSDGLIRLELPGRNGCLQAVICSNQNQIPQTIARG